ncbi:MAG: bifunctional phosphoribosyl-AMP cyclohydrolase/phosphoribosyl-ATP diphosphatase HisIE [Proteobacteria bacterium]|nr:bifunctional phosphoribosyl-AMP cyclohydrolase/phosphoribosyl-ATP diphosphatase HisIE [Pseudomonadota bacterium]
MTPDEIARIDFDKGGGLVPAVVQDADTLRVLMLAYMDRAALVETIELGEATFFSRSRGRRWRKGETSGNRMKVRNVSADCDGDTLLLRVEPAGPACHLGTTTCFGDETAISVNVLAELERTIATRADAPTSESYTARLLAEGVKRVAQKVGEEGVECALAGAAGSDAELCEESADLLYHLAVLLRARGLSMKDAFAVLARRGGAKT